MKRKLMLLLTCLFVGIGLVTAQITKVTGTVISEEDGLPVVGASILVKGTTDMDGKFTLSNVPSSAKTLVVSKFRKDFGSFLYRNGYTRSSYKTDC